MKTTLHEEAIVEARAARRWYAKRETEVGDSFMAALDAAVEMIAKTPNMWPMFEAGTHRYLIKNFPYSLIYRRLVTGIQVVAVMHSRRRPGYWRSRL
ncbi:MAG: type II toxin-antitoxin system RelE/ParE family toxin [Pyrinomonadaceae bacterium]